MGERYAFLIALGRGVINPGPQVEMRLLLIFLLLMFLYFGKSKGVPYTPPPPPPHSYISYATAEHSFNAYY